MRLVLERIFLWHIKYFAKLELRKVKPYVIGITGSIGKSSVRDAVATVLKGKYKVKVTGKANSESGIPLDILGLEMKNYTLGDWFRVFFLAPLCVITRKEKYEKYVVEMGVDSPYEPKNMTYLLKILEADSAVFVNAHSVHSENFDKLVKEADSEKRRDLIIKEIAFEKGKLMHAVKKTGFVIVNSDDKNVMDAVQGCEGKLVTVGSENSNIVFSDVEYDLDGFKCRYSMNYKGMQKNAVLNIGGQVLGKQYAITFGLAIAVGITQGIEFEQCVKSLEKYKLPPGRMSLLRGINDSYIIDGSYNASAPAVLDSLEVLSNLAKNRRKIAVIGDMRELGEEAEVEHKRVAQKLLNVADEIILVGSLSKKYLLNELLDNGFNKENVHWFENSFLAKDFVKQTIKGGEIILVKGSQNTIFLERVVEEIMEERDQAEILLCRRGQYWDKIRDRTR